MVQVDLVGKASLCLVGPEGMGKRTLIRALSAALGRSLAVLDPSAGDRIVVSGDVLQEQPSSSYKLSELLFSHDRRPLTLVLQNLDWLGYAGGGWSDDIALALD